MTSPEAQVHPTAVIDAGARVEPGASVWHFCHVMARAVIERGASLGQNVFVGPGVVIGSGTKIQNNVSVYEGVKIGKDCFIGPSAVFTNVRTPRAEVDRKGQFSLTVVHDGATIGANATVVCGVEIGNYAVVGAGAVVTKDVARHRLVVGVPAREAGWACRCGAILSHEPAGADGLRCPDCFLCPDCGNRYELDLAAGYLIESSPGAPTP